MRPQIQFLQQMVQTQPAGNDCARRACLEARVQTDCSQDQCDFSIDTCRSFLETSRPGQLLDLGCSLASSSMTGGTNKTSSRQVPNLAGYKVREDERQKRLELRTIAVFFWDILLALLCSHTLDRGGSVLQEQQGCTDIYYSELVAVCKGVFSPGLCTPGSVILVPSHFQDL